MGHVFAYSLQASILLLAMYFIYRWFLANENQNRFNRVVLLLIYAISFATFPLLEMGRRTLDAGQEITIPTIGNLSIVPIEEATAEPLFSPWRIVLWVYLAGMAVVALGTLVNIVRLCVIILKGRILHVDDCTLVLVKDKDMSPFSWLHFIVMNEADYERSGEMIISHEEQHIHCHHWADLLLAQAVIILCWYNPAAWLMRKELQTVHEYEADQCVLDDGVNARDYQMLLLKMAVGARFPSLANSLNHSIIKKRITMMNNQSTSARRRIRVLALAPALVLAVLATNIPCVASTLSAATTTTLVSEDGSKGNENSSNDQIIGKDALDRAEKMPEFAGGQAALIKFLSENIRYPESAKEKGIQGNVICRFVVLPDGSIGDVEVLRSGDASLDAEAIRVIKAMPKWTPGEQDGKPVAVKYMIPISFQLPQEETKGEVVNTIKLNANVTLKDNQDLSNLRENATYFVDGKKVENIDNLKPEEIASMNINKQGETPIVEITTKKAQKGSVNQIVGEGALKAAEKMPEFPGGMQALMKFLGENIKYPAEAAKKGIQGRAICQFVVERNGSISEVKVARSSGDDSLDKEAVRVVKSMPKWTPGEQDGKKVRVQYMLPISFQR